MAQIGIIGSEGAMGQALARVIEDAGHTLSGGIDRGGDAAALAEVLVDGESREIDCDCVVLSPPSSAVYELAAQLGVGVRWAGAGFELDVEADGRTAADDVRVVGSAAGVHGLDAAVAHAERVATQMLEATR